MSKSLTCPRGHIWQGDADERAEGCPVCAETVQPLAAPATADLAATRAENPGTVYAPSSARIPEVPGYVILAELGRGGMGVVYQARQIRAKRLVALKMILAGDYAGPADRDRFRIEAEAVAMLSHPSIVQIYEVGEHAGLSYFSLEYCAGGSLAKQLAGTPQPPREAAALVEQLARAMATAHTAGIVHRDLKPANVLFGGDGTPKIADFGLAKQLDSVHGQTQTGAILGTPSYMAPEQAGKAKEVGPAADVYALGAILYEMLTGRPPFRGTTPMDTLIQVATDEPVPPLQLNPRLPCDMETICLKCLAKEPSKRYASATALAEDLRRCRTGEPIEARPVGRLERGGKWVRRNPMVAGLGLATAVVAVVSLGLILWQWSEAVRQEGIAKQQEGLAKQQEGLANQRAADEKKARLDAEANQYFSNISAAAAEWQLGNSDAAEERLAECPADHRSWEWHYLRRLCRPALPILAPGQKDLYAHAYSPASRRILGYSKETGWAVWQADGWKLLASLAVRKDFDYGIDGMIFTPDGRTVVALDNTDAHAFARGGNQFAVLAFNAVSGQEEWQRQFSLKRLTWCRLSPQGDRVAILERSAKLAGALVIADARGGETKFTTQAHPGSPSCRPAFDATGEWLATAGKEGAVKLWNLRLKEGRTVAEGIAGGAHELAVAPDGALVAVAAPDGLRVIDALAGKELFRIPTQGRPATRLKFSPDGQRLAAEWLSDSRAVRVWAARTGQELGRLPGYYFSGYSWGPDDQLMISRSDQPIQLWDGKQHGSNRSVTVESGLHVIAFSPDSRLVAFSGAMHRRGKGHPISLHDLHSGREVAVLPGHRSSAHSLSFSAEGSRLASTGVDNTARVWDLGTQREIFNQKVVDAANPKPESVYEVRYRPDDKLITVRKHGLIQQWDVASNSLERSIHDGKELCVVDFHPDGRRALMLRTGGGLRWLDLQTGAVLGEIERPGRMGGYVQISPDGRWFLVNEQEISGAAPVPQDFKKKMELWEVATGRQVWSSSAVWHSAFTADSRRLFVLAVNSNRIALLETATARLVLTLTGQPTFPERLAVSPNGHWLVAGTDYTGPEAEENVMTIWDARPLD